MFVGSSRTDGDRDAGSDRASRPDRTDGAHGRADGHGAAAHGGRASVHVRRRSADGRDGARGAGRVRRDRRGRVRGTDAEAERRAGQGTSGATAPVPGQPAADAQPRADTAGPRARTDAHVPVRRLHGRAGRVPAARGGEQDEQ